MPVSPSPQRTAALLRKCTRLRPQLGVVLGSGFSGVLAEIELRDQVGFSRLPGFPPIHVEGHGSKVLLGYLASAPVLVMAGRAHFYEGHRMEAIIFPIRVLAEFGIRRLLLTNAAGGINRRFRTGDFMCVTDHINMMGVNPLRPENPIGGRTSFLDLSAVYDAVMQQIILQAARDTKTPVHRGVYLAVSGPSYETPAEIRAFRRLGADAVGMSMVPEAIVAREHGLAVAGLSCITNLAAGLNPKPLSHAEVLDAGRHAAATAARLLRRVAELTPQIPG